MSKWLFLLVGATRQLWIRVAGFTVIGLVAALLAAALARWVPADLALKVGTGAVDQVLSILATSMLAVATFSLATLVTAYTAVANITSPRAARLLVSDGRGQSALATFIGAFVYSVVGIFALQTGYYGAQGRVIVFVVTMAVLLLVVLALLRWIDQLSKLGQVDEAIDRVKGATQDAFRGRFAARAQDLDDEQARASVPVDADEVGHVRNIDLEALDALAAELGVVLLLEALPGDFVHPAQPLFRYAGRATLPTAEISRLRSKWVLGDRRTFDQDPRFGLTVLGEIAAKALSPGVNDAGTAIDVVSTAVAVLTEWIRNDRGEPDARPSHLRFRALSPHDLLQDVFGPVAQFGAGQADVAVRLQVGLEALSALPDPDMRAAARDHSRRALERALNALELQEERDAATAAAARVQKRGPAEA